MRIQGGLKRHTRGCWWNPRRVKEAEKRINAKETRVQSSENVLFELVKLQIQTEAKLTDFKGRSRHDKIRIPGVKESAEGTSVITFVEDLAQVNSGIEGLPYNILLSSSLTVSHNQKEEQLKSR